MVSGCVLAPVHTSTAVQHFRKPLLAIPPITLLIREPEESSLLHEVGQRADRALPAALVLQVDRVVTRGNHNAITGQEIPGAEPGTEAKYLYYDT